MNGSTEKIWIVVNEIRENVAVLVAQVTHLMQRQDKQDELQQSTKMCDERYGVVNRRIDDVEELAQSANTKAGAIKEGQHNDAKRFIWVIIAAVVSGLIGLAIGSMKG